MTEPRSFSPRGAAKIIASKTGIPAAHWLVEAIDQADGCRSGRWEAAREPMHRARVPDRREQVAYATGRGLSQRRVCTLIEVGRSALHYRSRKGERDAPVLTRIAELAAQYPRHECLNLEWCRSRAEAKVVIEAPREVGSLLRLRGLRSA